jgi:hypothetical protein
MAGPPRRASSYLEEASQTAGRSKEPQGFSARAFLTAEQGIKKQTGPDSFHLCVCEIDEGIPTFLVAPLYHPRSSGLALGISHNL